MSNKCFASPNQEKHFDPTPRSLTIVKSSIRAPCKKDNGRAASSIFPKPQLNQAHTGVLMSGQVILYFDDQADALRFALAAGSVMAGDSARVTEDLVQETARVSRIRLEDANAGKIKNPDRVA